jgi:hypothetical protein
MIWSPLGCPRYANDCGAIYTVTAIVGAARFFTLAATSLPHVCPLTVPRVGLSRPTGRAASVFAPLLSQRRRAPITNTLTHTPPRIR